MGKKLNAGDASVLVLKVSELLKPAPLSVLWAVRDSLTQRIAVLQSDKPEKAAKAKSGEVVS